MANNTSNNIGAWGCAVVLLISGFLVFLGLNPIKAPGKAKEAEAKQSLHMIQLGVERFAVDHEGCYPAYLIGGSPAEPHGTPGTIPFTSDVLLREGYLESYPANPFVRVKNPRSLALQQNLPSSITGNDPLRPGDPEGDLLGYRFGEAGDLMGQVLCDPRYEKWSLTNPLSGDVEMRETWAIIEYPFWDTWNGKTHKPEFLPGMFFYKSLGPMIALPKSDDEKINGQQGSFNEHLSLAGESVGPGSVYPSEVDLNLEIDKYIMGVYGKTSIRGMDVLGDEAIYVKSNLPSWTRSAYSAVNRGGSPFNLSASDGAGSKQIHGNPNGIKDGVILVLTDGCEYIGK